MIKQLLDEVRQAELDPPSRQRLKEIYEISVRELAETLSPDLAAELDRLALPFESDEPSDAELRVAQAQLVGWLEGLFHGIQATLFAQQMAAQSPARADAAAAACRPASAARARARRRDRRLPVAPRSPVVAESVSVEFLLQRERREVVSERRNHSPVIHPQPVDEGCGRAVEARRWPDRGQRSPSPTCTSTPSTRCSTERRGSPTSSRPRPRDGQPALAITDHGNMYGVLDFYKACREQGITPIIGTEAYMAANSPLRPPGPPRPDRRHRRRGRARREALLPPDAARRDRARATAT